MAYDPFVSRPLPRAGGDGLTRDAYDEEGFDETRETRRAAPDADNGNGRSAGDLLRQLFGDLTMLFRKELALAASEINRSVDDAKRGATSMITGGAVLYAGVLFLLGAVTLWLATMMATWAAALAVGALVTAAGLVLVGAGKKQVSATSFNPERTMASLRKDKQAVERHAS